MTTVTRIDLEGYESVDQAIGDVRRKLAETLKDAVYLEQVLARLTQKRLVDAALLESEAAQKEK